MKIRLAILVLICTVFSGSLTAQRNSPARIFSYFKKGIGISFLSPQETENSGVRAGFHLGFAPSFPFSSNTYIKPEIAFSAKGGKADYGSLTPGVFNGDILYKINYLELPVVFGYQASKFLSLEAGFYGAIPVGASFSFDGQFAAGYGEFDKDELHQYDYGLIGGIKIGPIGIRYYHGLTNVAATQLAREFLGTAIQNTIQIYFQRSAFRNLLNR